MDQSRLAHPARSLRASRGHDAPAKWGPLLTLTLVLALAAVPARADFDQTFRFDAESLRVANLIGAVTIEGHTGGEFLVEVQVRGKDASDGALRFDTEQGSDARLSVIFPERERRYVYPPLGRGSRSSFTQGRDRSWWGELFGREKIEVRGSGSGLELWADITVKVPRGGALVVGNGAGVIRATEVDGQLELSTRTGAIDASGIEGSLLADTGSGHVEVNGIRGDVFVDTGSGHVDGADLEGDKVHVDTGSGHVTLRKVRAASVEVDTGSGKVMLEALVGESVVVDTGSGGVDVRDVAVDRMEIDTGSGSVQVDLTRMGQGDFVVDTGSGSITFLMPENPSAHVTAETGSGGIDVRVTDAQMLRDKRDHVEFEVGSGAAKVRLDTGSGRIRISSR